jgi:hypothetical protein
MRSTLGAMVAVSATVVILLTSALASFDVWNRHALEAILPSSDAAGALIVDRSIDLGAIIRSSWLAGFLWVGVVVLPAAVLVKHLASRVLMRLAGAVIVSALSAVAFCSFQTIHSFQPPSIFLLVGGVIGVVGFGVALWAVPPNTSFERTRER